MNVLDNVWTISNGRYRELHTERLDLHLFHFFNILTVWLSDASQPVEEDKRRTAANLSPNILRTRLIALFVQKNKKIYEFSIRFDKGKNSWIAFCDIIDAESRDNERSDQFFFTSLHTMIRLHLIKDIISLREIESNGFLRYRIFFSTNCLSRLLSLHASIDYAEIIPSISFFSHWQDY